MGNPIAALWNLLLLVLKLALCLVFAAYDDLREAFSAGETEAAAAAPITAADLA